MEKFRESLELNSSITAVLGPYQGGAHNVHYTAHVKAVVGGSKATRTDGAISSRPSATALPERESAQPAINTQTQAGSLPEMASDSAAVAPAQMHAVGAACDVGVGAPIETDSAAVVGPVVPLEVDEYAHDEHGDDGDVNNDGGAGEWY